MKMISSKTLEKIQAGMGVFANNKYIKSVSNAMILIMTPIIVGSIFTLLTNLPIKAWTDFISKTGLVDLIKIPVSFTSNITALLAAFLIAYSLAERFNKDGLMSGVLGLICFLIVTPTGQVKINDKMISYIPFDWIGPKGLFVAILIGLLTARIYVFFIEKGFIIKMPEGVPPNVARSFNTLIPGFVTVILALFIAIIFKFSPYGSLNQAVFTCIQTPLQGLTGSYISLLIINLAIGILWFFGIHGTVIVFNGIMGPLLLSMDMQNQAAYQAGQALPNIVGMEFFRAYVFMSGTGLTIGLALLMAFFAKSKQYKILGRLVIPTSIFNINEPITFGTPIVLNPVMLIPYLAAPILSSTIAYAVTAIGLVPRINGVQLPWPLPIGISGVLLGSWKIAVLQFFMVFVSLAVYYIPFRYMDRKAYELEKAGSSYATSDSCDVSAR
ncbi:PTS sugar transporter subunit IIC [Iocasia frigidifontis]|uniref:Permease IIC component n=1 Tax=Iocasia fonsfrigidae TaxID=2682810 RepID=A0A8A7KCU5_9FIRM|nr:PTS transporter subunit EIIC [Iocasia fonsfrigidae]QTL99261.1 PTS sugar transporter subunit IIC [Iocasia fonsfrigidae]